MKIAMLASEANPLAKTGGLADVVHALSRELSSKGEEVIVVMPYFRSIARSGKCPKLQDLPLFSVKMGWRNALCDPHVCQIEGVKYYLLGNGNYFDRERLYGYDDDGERFAFFSLVAMEFLARIGFEPDIIHLHDWQVGMVPAIGKVLYRNCPCFASSRYVLTIHNPAFKGYLDPYSLGDLYNLPSYLYDDGTVRFEGMVSTLKAGIVLSDKITTVSPTHREELLRPATSQGLDGVLRLREYDFCGFVNGIDTKEWDPGNDPFIYAPFTSKNLRSGKNANKEELAKMHRLDVSRGPLFGLVSRLTYQKGIDLILSSIRPFLEQGACLEVLGNGEYELEQAFLDLQRSYPTLVHVHIGYSNELAHQIYAASDFFLMPSLFEPCGIGQLLAERYGSLPLARDTGGIHDTVVSYNGSNQDSADGVLFTHYLSDAMGYAFHEAMKIYANKPLFLKMGRNAMKADHSWETSAELYAGLYRSIIG
ncbi:MAG: glycogen synthase [Candidatus Enteromonas sp.]|nr:glycogen synthase [Candidatus Enteromonas sp.]